MRRVVTVGLLSLCCAWGCGRPMAAEARGQESGPGGPVLSEHRPDEKAGDGLSRVGEDCGQHGRGGCRSGLCIHVKAAIHEGFVCSELCSSDASCPTAWRCREVYPGSGVRACAPEPEPAPVEDRNFGPGEPDAGGVGR